MALRLPYHRLHPVAAPAVLGLGGGLAAALLAWAVHRAAPGAAVGPVGLALLVGLAGLLASAGLAQVLRQLLLSRRAAEVLTTHLTNDLERLAMVAQETTNIVVITDAKRRITWVNEAFERISGFGAMEVLGLSPGALLQCEDTSAETVAQMRAALDAGQLFRGELLNRAKDGRLYWLDLTIQPLRDAEGRLDGFMAIQTDVTERHRMESELRRQAALLRAAIDAIEEAFVLFDPDDRLVYCNERYRGVYATSADLLVPGMRFEDIIRIGAQRGQYREAIGRVDDWVAERLARHRAPEVPLLQTTDEGRVLRVREHRLPDGHMVGFRIDITDLMRARQAAEQANQAKSEFIGTISHELRTPLQSIIGFSELGLHFAKDQPMLHGMFSDVLAGGRRMLRLVNGLLDINKIDGTAGSLDLRRGDLAELTREVTHELRLQLAQRGLTLQLPDPLPVLPALVEPHRMRQVLRNVLANALRFAPQGSQIEVQAVDAGPDHVALAIRDHGPGIPPDELESIFEPFVQSSRTRSGAGGTGLGLTISRRIVVAHGGSITADEAQGGGARFTIRLPAVTAPGSLVPAATAATGATSATTAADEPDTRRRSAATAGA